MKRFCICAILSCICSIFLFSCTEDETDLGMGLQDPSSVFDGKVCDTLTVEAVTVFDDSLLTSNYSSGVIGYYRDNIFGEVKATMYTQASLSTPSTGVSFMNTTIDSVVISLVCNGSFPKSSDSNSVYNLNFEVFEISEDLYLDTSYYATDSKTLGNKYYDNTIAFKPIDTVINIKLDPTIYSKFENKEYANNETFLEELKGLCIRMNYNTKTNCMVYVNYWATATGLTVYYKESENQDTSSSYAFLFDKTAAHFNRYEQDYTGTELAVFQTNPYDSISGNGALYLESLGGTSIKLRFPYLKAWGEQHPNAIIHQAELYVKVPDLPINDNPPGSLVCYRYLTPDGTATSIIADMLDGVLSSGFDGAYNSSDRQYRMRISRQIQQILTGVLPDYGLRLFVNSRRTTANRCVVGGTNNKSIKLKIIYTE